MLNYFEEKSSLIESLNQVICFLYKVFVESQKIREIIREEKMKKTKGEKA